MEIFAQSSCDVKRQYYDELYHIYTQWTWCAQNYEAPKEVVLDPNTRYSSPKQNTAVAANERIKEVTDHQPKLTDVE